MKNFLVAYRTYKEEQLGTRVIVIVDEEFELNKFNDVLKSMHDDNFDRITSVSEITIVNADIINGEFVDGEDAGC